MPALLVWASTAHVSEGLKHGTTLGVDVEAHMSRYREPQKTSKGSCEGVAPLVQALALPPNHEAKVCKVRISQNDADTQQNQQVLQRCLNAGGGHHYVG